MSDLEKITDAAIAAAVEEKPKQPVRRYASDGVTEIETGGHVSAWAMNQPPETREQQQARLQAPTDQTADAFGRILLDVEETKARMGLQDDEAPRTAEDNEALVSRAVLATAVAADEVVAAHQPTYAGRIAEHREEAFRRAWDEQDEYQPEEWDVREATHEAVSAEAQQHPLNPFNPNPEDGVTLHGAPEEEEEDEWGEWSPAPAWDATEE